MVDGRLDIVIVRLDGGAEAARAAASLLSTDERQRGMRLGRDRDRQRFTIGRGRLRQLLGERLTVAPEAVELVYGARGKPRLHARFGADLRFNVSHYEGVAVFAFALGREVGVDIEGVRKMADADDVAALVFSPTELEAYMALDRDLKPDGFFNGWTRKEAFIKALGNGLQHPLHSFDVSLTPGEPARLLRVEHMPGDACGWALQALTLGPRLAGAVVVQAPIPVREERPDVVVTTDERHATPDG